MSEEVSATDTGAEQSAQSVDPVNAFEALLSKSIPDSGEPSDAPQEPSEPEPELSEEATEEQPAEELITVKIDGQEVQVTRDELIANYQKGQAANQRFEQAANERKAAQAEYQQVAQQRLQAINSLNIAQQVIQAQIPERPVWDRAAYNADPIEYQNSFQERVAIYESGIAQLQQIAGQREQLAAIQAQEDQAQQQAFIQSQVQMLREALPEWTDTKKATAEKAEIKAYLSKVGYQAQEIDSLMDARQVIVAREAMLYRQMMAKAQETAKKVQTLPKVQRPGVTQATDGRSKDMQALRKTGSAAAAASIFEKLL